MRDLALPHAAAEWLAETMARNAARFGGWSMELDPAADPEPATAVPTPPVTPAAPEQSAVWDDPIAAKTEIEKLRRENAKDRTNAKQQAADDARTEYAQIIGKALGLVEDEPVDPAALTTEVGKAKADAKQARVELAVYRAAEKAGGDATALLDSKGFLATLDGIDPNDGEAIAKAIAAAIGTNPRLGAAPAKPIAPLPNPAQGAASASSARPKSLTDAVSSHYRG